MPERVLFLAAHPDDIENVMGGTALKHSGEGDLCWEAIMTRGERGAILKRNRGAVLAGIREREGRAGGAAIGMKEVMFFDFPDGGLKNTERLRGVIEDLIRRFKPDIIYAPEFHHSPYPHPDHINLGKAAAGVRNSMEKKPILRFFHPLLPTHVYSVEQYSEQKLRSMAMHRSQRWINRMILTILPLVRPFKYLALRRKAGSRHFEFYREMEKS